MDSGLVATAAPPHSLVRSLAVPDVLESISTFYGLDIQSLRSQLITRSLDNARPKKMYFITPQVTRTACLDACTCFITPQVRHVTSRPDGRRCPALDLPRHVEALPQGCAKLDQLSSPRHANLASV